MTGRRLYEHHCDALAATTTPWLRDTYVRSMATTPVAWPFLSSNERAVWNAFARRITPTTKKVTLR